MLRLIIKTLQEVRLYEMSRINLKEDGWDKKIKNKK
jgi:hypothetical protein